MLRFKEWWIQNEGFREPPQERPDEVLRHFAKQGHPGALPSGTVDGSDLPPTPNRKMKRKMKPKMKKR